MGNPDSDSICFLTNSNLPFKSAAKISRIKPAYRRVNNVAKPACRHFMKVLHFLAYAVKHGNRNPLNISRAILGVKNPPAEPLTT